jgi:uncharacterized repeat protein (TIGR03803 family)
VVESGIFFSSKPGLDLLHVKHSLIQPLLVFVQQLHGLLRPGITAVVLTCIYRERVLLPVKTRPGLGRDFGGLLARVVISRFQQKAKQNRHAARFATMLNLFSHRDNKTSGATEQVRSRPVESLGDFPKRNKIMSFAKFTQAALLLLAGLAAVPLSRAQTHTVHLCGTTYFGGEKQTCGGGCGVVFKLDVNGNETVLYTFSSFDGGQQSSGGLILDSAGNLYGTTEFGGDAFCGDPNPFGCGVVFKLNKKGTETVVRRSTGGADGAHPSFGSLIMDSAAICTAPQIRAAYRVA